MRDEDNNVESLQDKIRNSMADVSVRCINKQRIKRIVIKDIDALSTTEEVASALLRETGVAREELGGISFRETYANTKWATVLLPADKALQVCSAGRIKVGWVSCRAVSGETTERCYRCWGIGHRAKNCEGIDRGKTCFLCGKGGHFRVDCPEMNKRAGSALSGSYRRKSFVKDAGGMDAPRSTND